MGAFQISVEIGDISGSRYREVSGLVDTSASYTALPGSMLCELGIIPDERWLFVLADGRQVELEVGQGRVRIGEREHVTVVVSAEEGARPLLGAVTLEKFRLGVDPVARKLIPVPGLLMSSLPRVR